jgi:hypothetical protein
VNWVGFYTDGKAADNWMHEDSGHVTLWSCSYSSIVYCRIIGDPSKISTIPPGNNITNQSGIRTENTLGCLISDCYLADFLTTKVNAAGVLSYKSRNMTITHCEFHNCQNGFQPKGGYAEDTPLNPGGFTGLRFCYNLIHPTVKFGLRLHSQVSTTPEDYHHYYCNRITSSNNVIELTSTSTGGFGGSNSNDNFYGIQFYNNVLRDNANEGLFWYSSNPYNINPGARDNSWANNIILRANYDWRAYGTPQTHFTPAWVLGMQRNIYSSQGANYASFSDGSLSFSNAQAAGLESDSLFSVDAGLDADARPQPGSPAIGLGRDIHGTFGPVNGVIDAGCYPTGTEVIGIRNG